MTSMTSQAPLAAPDICRRCGFRVGLVKGSQQIRRDEADQVRGIAFVSGSTLS
jgi:hypothetical protein